MTHRGYYRLIRFGAVLAILGMTSLLNSCGTTATYSTPAWAAGISDGNAPYYYFPDYDMYYDASAGQYYYLNNGAWLSSAAVPYPGVDLNRSYVVELQRGTQRPWTDNDFYRRNYPEHEQEEYTRIARDHNLVPNPQQNHEIVPRAYDENSQRMIFEERQAAQAQAQAHAGARPAPGPRVTHQVPMQSIAPNMPAQSRSYRYGGNAKGR